MTLRTKLWVVAPVVVSAALWMFDTAQKRGVEPDSASPGEELEVSEGRDQGGIAEIGSELAPSVSNIRSLIGEEISYIENVAEIENFSARHGLFSSHDLSIYQSYPSELLDELAIKGDLLAMEVLANRAISNGESELAMDIYTLSAIHGGTMGLTYMAIHRFYDGLNGDVVVDKDSILDAFAYLELAAIRGNLNSLRTGIHLLDESELTLTAEDQAEISARAIAIYEEFEEIREDLGLSEYDNSISLPMLIGIQEDYPLSKNPSGWGLQYYQ